MQSWLYAVNDQFSQSAYPHHSWLPHRSLLSPRFATVVHVVRHPPAHISAFSAHSLKTFSFLQQQLLA